MPILCTMRLSLGRNLAKFTQLGGSKAGFKVSVADAGSTLSQGATLAHYQI